MAGYFPKLFGKHLYRYPSRVCSNVIATLVPSIKSDVSLLITHITLSKYLSGHLSFLPWSFSPFWVQKLIQDRIHAQCLSVPSIVMCYNAKNMVHIF